MLVQVQDRQDLQLLTPGHPPPGSLRPLLGRKVLSPAQANSCG